VVGPGIVVVVEVVVGPGIVEVVDGCGEIVVVVDILQEPVQLL
jgi:hypothetical protein